MSIITPSQTVGPYYAYCLTPQNYALRPVFSNDLRTPGLAGAPIRIEGAVYDGDGVGIADSMVEIWQADAAGSFDHALDRKHNNSGFRGFGRVEPDKSGSFSFVTVKPGRVKGPNGQLQAPHIDVAVFARGMLKHLMTRIYFADEASNAEDEILALVPEERRKTLIATVKQTGAETIYHFDIRVQDSDGGAETVFFDA